MPTISMTDLVDLNVRFCELYSGKVFFPYQEQFARRVIRSVLMNDGQEITALFARQSGKTETISIVVGGMMILLPKLASMPIFAGDKRLAMFKDGVWTGIFAPSQRQAQITYSRIKSRIQGLNAQRVLNDADFRLAFSTSNGQTVALTNGSFVTALSASPDSSIEGESFKIIIVEEAQDVSDFKIKKSIHPMGAAYNATIIKIGTATTFKGDFYDACQRNKIMYDNGEIAVKNHFEYDYQVATKYNAKYARYVEQEKKRLGEDSDEFLMSYCLRWILQKGMFIDLEVFEKRNLNSFLGRIPYDKLTSCVAGIDVAAKSDSTVITITAVDWDNPVINEEHVTEEGEFETFTVYNTRIVDWLEIQNEDYDSQYTEILNYLAQFNVKRVVIDATRESSLADRLRVCLPYEVVSFVYTQRSKSDLFKHLDREIKSGRATVPADESTRTTREFKRFIEQMSNLQKGYSGSNLLVAHPDVRGAHDDYANSWALAVWGSSVRSETLGMESRDAAEVWGAPNSRSFYSSRNAITARRM